MGGLSYPRKPWAYGDRVFDPVYRYSSLHKLLSGPLVPLVDTPRICLRVLLYHSAYAESVASVLCLSPVIFSARIRLTSELLRFL